MSTKKEQIIITAMGLFVDQGFENTPTSQISEESNVATGTMFYHFKTKEDLINEIYIYVKTHMGSLIFKEISENSKDNIKSVWINLIKWGNEFKYERRFLEKFYGSVYINNLTIEQVRNNFGKGCDIFSKAKKEKIIKNISMDLFGDITFCLVHSFCKDFSNKKKLSKKDLELSFDVYWGAISK